MKPLAMPSKVKQFESRAFSRFLVKNFELISKTLPLRQIPALVQQPQISIELLLNQSEVRCQLSQSVSKIDNEVRRGLKSTGSNVESSVSF